MPFSNGKQFRARFLQLCLLDGAVELDKVVTQVESLAVARIDLLDSSGNLAGQGGFDQRRQQGPDGFQLVVGVVNGLFLRHGHCAIHHPTNQKCEDDQRVQEILDMLPCFNSAFRPRLCIKHVELSLYIDVRITTLID